MEYYYHGKNSLTLAVHRGGEPVASKTVTITGQDLVVRWLHDCGHQ